MHPSVGVGFVKGRQYPQPHILPQLLRRPAQRRRLPEQNPVVKDAGRAARGLGGVFRRRHRRLRPTARRRRRQHHPRQQRQRDGQPPDAAPRRRPANPVQHNTPCHLLPGSL